MADLLPTAGYKGTRDFYPEEMKIRNWFFSKMRTVVEKYGYEEMQGPLLESLDVFAAKSGDELVNEQIYHFEDRGQRRVAIRPEMTPTVARMLAGRLEEMKLPLRWYSIANFMRYERPQKGRLREFWQLNVDILGAPDTRADWEMMSLTVDLMKEFGADAGMFKIKINHREFFNDVLRQVLKVQDNEVQIISKAVDKRSKLPREQYESWLGEAGIAKDKVELLDRVFNSDYNAIKNMLPEPSRGATELDELFRMLEETGIASYCCFDFSIVRGFDYYTGTIFEVYDENPDNRRALFGGGRYDNLVGLFKKAEVSGIGFGFGDVTFQNFLEGHGLISPEVSRQEQVLITVFDDVPFAEYARIAQELREAGLKTAMYLGEAGKIKKQFQYAEKLNYPVAVIMGQDEMQRGEVIVKDLLSREQQTVARTDMIKNIRQVIGQKV